MMDAVPAYTLPTDSSPIQVFGIYKALSMHSIPIHLNQVRLVLHPRTDKDDRQEVLEQQNMWIFPAMESIFTYTVYRFILEVLNFSIIFYATLYFCSQSSEGIILFILHYSTLTDIVTSHIRHLCQI